jgi:predicted nucleotidyltransferase
MKFGLTEKEIMLLVGVFEKTRNIEKVFIYGSRVKGNYKKTSDIDLVVCFAYNVKKSVAMLKSELEDLPIIYSIDIIDEEEIEVGKFKNEYARTRQVFYMK